ncbi:MAG TPA: C4-type zinc ribbon domain-containing protein, partial [Anaerolineae bacterium]
AEMEAEWEQRVAGLKVQQNELALRLNTLNGLRQKQVALIAPDLLAEYEQLSQRRGGIAVAALRGNECQGCRLTVSANKVKDAAEGKLVYCGSCGRILNPI